MKIINKEIVCWKTKFPAKTSKIQDSEMNKTKSLQPG